MWCLIFFCSSILEPIYRFLNGGNMFTTPFIWIFGKIQFFWNCWHEFHFCQCEIDCATFASAYFCWHKITWVRKTATLWHLVISTTHLICSALISFGKWFKDYLQSFIGNGQNFALLWEEQKNQHLWILRIGFKTEYCHLKKHIFQ